MPYSEGTRLPGETASKLGHLAVVESPWVRSLVAEFEQTRPVDADPSQTTWTRFDPTSAASLRSLWAVDGSFVPVVTQEKPPREVAFVKSTLLTVDQAKLGAIDKEHPHPLLLRDVMAESAVFHATVFPLKNIRTALGSNYEMVRHIVRDSMQIDEQGAFYETLKWIAYQKWRPNPVPSPAFDCPHCHHRIEGGLTPDADEATCPACKNLVFLTDMLGFHLDMDEASAPDSVAACAPLAGTVASSTAQCAAVNFPSGVGITQIKANW